MDRQKVFDRVAMHLLAQNEKATVRPPSVVPGWHCFYKVPGRCLRCAIGCLLTATPDDELEALQGVMSEDAILDKLHQAGIEVVADDLGLLLNLQRVHDQYTPEEWPTVLRAVAKEWALDAGVVG